jgi:hypothetical protein
VFVAGPNHQIGPDFSPGDAALMGWGFRQCLTNRYRAVVFASEIGPDFSPGNTAVLGMGL